MGGRTKTHVEVPPKDPAPVEAPPDQPIPAAPAPRPKEAPRTMKDLRETRQPRRAARARPPENVLREGLRLERVPDPAILVLFGATGDLAHRKVIPALYHLWRTNLLPHEFALLAMGRREYDDDTFRKEIRASLEQYSRILPLDEDAWRSFSERIRYHRLDFGDPGGFDLLSTRLDEMDIEPGTRGNRLFYLATQPSQFAEIVSQLGRVGLDHEKHDGGWRRIVIEKPFGHDLESAKRLSAISSSSGSATGSSSRSGTAATSTTSRSRSRSRSGSRTAGPSTRRRAPFATSSRTTSCSSSAWSRWSRRPRSRPTPCVTRR